MNDFLAYLTTSFALILVIEGLFYAVFPDMMRRLMALAVMVPVSRLRLFGCGLTAAGFGVVWLLQTMNP